MRKHCERHNITDMKNSWGRCTWIERMLLYVTSHRHYFQLMCNNETDRENIVSGTEDTLRRLSRRLLQPTTAADVCLLQSTHTFVDTHIHAHVHTQ